MARAKGIASAEWEELEGRLVRGAAAALAVVAAGYGQLVPERARRTSAKESRRINQAELQQDLQRFAGVFMGRVSDAAGLAIPELDGETRTEMMRRALRYESSALDIATGSYPEVNLLDMVAFVTLSHEVLEMRLVPEVFGAAALPLVEAFATSSRDIDEIAAKLLTAAEKAQLKSIIRAWQRENPDLTEVEGVRLFTFSEVAGDIATVKKEELRGLLSTVKTATVAADQALLLGDRAMFLAQRIPFLLRLQVRVGTQEIVGDTVTSLGRLEDLAVDLPELRPLLGDVSTLVDNAGQLSRESRELVRVVQRAIEEREKAGEKTGEKTGEGLERILTSANELTDKSITLLSELKTTLGGDDEAGATMTRRLDRLVRRWLAYGAAVAVGVIAIFWLGFVIAKRFVGA